MIIKPLKKELQQLKTDTYALYLSYKDPRVPWYAKVIIAATVGYALSPIDLIPDFIPVLGQLDDLIIVPAGISLALKMIPKEVLDEYREKAKFELNGSRPKNWAAAFIIVLIWLLLIYLFLILMGLPLIISVNAQQFSPFSDFDYGNDDITKAQISATARRVTGGPFEGTRVIDSRIDIKYTPDANVGKCEKIVFIQVVKRTGTRTGPDGKLGTPDDVNVPLMPSDFENFEGARRIDRWTIKEEGLSVDRHSDGTEPYYGGGTSSKPSILENGGTEHSNPGSDGNNPKSATLEDSPHTDEDNWPSGISKLTREFETAAICARGENEGHVFGVIRWEFEKEKRRAAKVSITSVSTVAGPPDSGIEIMLPDGNISGTYPVYSLDAPGQPSENFWRAVRLWIAKHRFTLSAVTPPGYGKVAVAIPGPSAGRAVVKISTPVLVPEDPALAARGLRLSGSDHSIEAFTPCGKPFGFFPFGAPVTVAFRYDQAEVEGLDESTLGIVLFESGVYSNESISVINRDQETNMITFTTDRLGLFAIAGRTVPEFPLALLLPAAGLLSIVLLFLLLRKIRKKGL